jgi:Uma2 family endonuclease
MTAVHISAAEYLRLVETGVLGDDDRVELIGGVIVAGTLRDHADAHPTRALLVVEVADSSLGSDRLSKSRIYAAAGIPEYWIVNLRGSAVEVHRDPDFASAVYRTTLVRRAGDRLELVALSDARVTVEDLLPARR